MNQEKSDKDDRRKLEWLAKKERKRCLNEKEYGLGRNKEYHENIYRGTFTVDTTGERHRETYRYRKIR